MHLEASESEERSRRRPRWRSRVSGTTSWHSDPTSRRERPNAGPRPPSRRAYRTSRCSSSPRRSPMARRKPPSSPTSPARPCRTPRGGTDEPSPSIAAHAVVYREREAVGGVADLADRDERIFGTALDASPAVDAVLEDAAAAPPHPTRGPIPGVRTTDNDVQPRKGTTVKKKSILALVSAAAVVVGLAGCSTPMAGTAAEAAAAASSASRCPPSRPSAGSRTATPSRSSSRSQGYTVDLQYAKDDIPTQVSQIENMITKGAEALIIAAIDGTTLTSVLRTPPTGHPGHRLRPPDPRHRERRLLRDVRQLPRRPAAGLVGPQRPRPRRPRRHADRRRPRRAVQHRAVRRLARRQQRVLLLQRRHGRAPAADRRRHARGQAGQTDIEQAATLRWDGDVAQSRMEDLLTANYSTAPRSTRFSRPYDGISRGIISRTHRRRLQRWRRMADHLGPGRRGRLGQGDPRGRAVRDDLQGHPRAREGRRRHGRSQRSTATSPRSTTPRPTTTA